MTLGEKIREVRERKGVSQYDLSRSIFVAQDEIGRWELDKSIPSKKRLEDLEKFFELEKNYFISEEEYEILDKKYEKKRRIKKILKIAKYPLILVVLIFILQFAFLPRKGKIYEIDGKTYAVYENKGYFGDGVVEFIPSDSSVVNIPDTISVWNGIYFFKFKVKYVYLPGLKDKNASINLPRYFENFCNTYPEGDRVNFAYLGHVEFYKISVSPLNEKYDSRDDCGCLIDSKTDTLLYSSKYALDSVKETALYEGIKGVSSYGFVDFFRTGQTRYTLPSSIEFLDDFAFGSANGENLNFYEGTNLVLYFDFGSIKKIGNGVLWPTTFANTKIILPKTLESIHSEALNSYNSIKQLANVFYKGSKEDWEKVEIIDNRTHELKLGGENSKFYYYSEEKPSENGVYWHYDENNDPVVWE